LRARSRVQKISCISVLQIWQPYRPLLILVLFEPRRTLVETSIMSSFKTSRLRWVPTGDFRPLSHRISEMVQDRIGPKLLIGSRIHALHWYQNQRLWLTLNWRWTAIMRSGALLYYAMSFGAHHRNLNENRPILSVTKGSPGIVSSM